MLQRALEFSCVAGHKPKSFRPQVRMLRRMEGVVVADEPIKPVAKDMVFLLLPNPKI